MATAGYTFYFEWEMAMIEWLQTNLSSAAVKLLDFCSCFGEELVLILVLGFIYWGYDKELGKRVGLNALMAASWGTMIKCVVMRRRPYFDNENIKVLRPVSSSADLYDISAQGYSFPSIHSTNAASMYGSIAREKKNKWLIILAFLLPFLTGLSRITVGVHFPTDVLGGWLLGIAAMLVVPALSNRIQKKELLYVILFLTAIPGFFFCRIAEYYTSVGLLAGFIAGTLFEEKVVRFEDTENVKQLLLRVLGGIVVILLLNILLKAAIPKDLAGDADMASMMVRFARYAILGFVGFGLYPLCFRKGKANVTEQS